MSTMMSNSETKKCRIIPKDKRFVPDILLQNKRIVEETVMDLNKSEIRRAMSFAEVYIINGDIETLATEKDYFIKDAGVCEDDKVETDPEPESPVQTPGGDDN